MRRISKDVYIYAMGAKNEQVLRVALDTQIQFK